VRAFTPLAYAHRPGMAADLNAWTLDFATRHPGCVPSATFFPEPEAEQLSALDALDLGDIWLRAVCWENAANLLDLAPARLGLRPAPRTTRVLRRARNTGRRSRASVERSTHGGGPLTNAY
jgi:hypothetical protein